MSFFKIFKDPEPEEAPVEKAATAPKTSSFTTSSFESVTALQSSSKVLGDVDADYKQGFTELLTEGDYYNFSGSLATLDSLPLDDQQKYETAFKTISRFGVTVDKILKAADDYLSVVQSQDAEFQTQLQEKKKLEIEDREAAILKDQQLIQEATERINAAKIAANESKIDLAKKEASFNATYKNVVEEVEAKVSKIKLYLQ